MFSIYFPIFVAVNGLAKTKKQQQMDIVLNVYIVADSLKYSYSPCFEGLKT